MKIVATIIQASAGTDQTLYLTSRGRVISFGYGNKYGQVGNGSTVPAIHPTNLDLQDITQIAAGFDHCFALTKEAELWVWGRNDKAQLGFGPGPSELRPLLHPDLRNIVQIVSGWQTGYALNKMGEVLAWGENARQECGQHQSHKIFSAPTPVPDLPLLTRIASGYSHALGLDKDGGVWRWGAGQWDQRKKADDPWVSPVSGLDAVKAIGCEGSVSYALTRGGILKFWPRAYPAIQDIWRKATFKLSVFRDIPLVAAFACVSKGLIIQTERGDLFLSDSSHESKFVPLSGPRADLARIALASNSGAPNLDTMQRETRVMSASQLTL